MKDLKPLAAALATLSTAAIAYAGADAQGFEQAFAEAMAAQASQKPDPLAIVKAAVATAKEMAALTGNEKAAKLVADIAETSDDLIAGKFFEILPDLAALWGDVKALKKS